MQNLKQIINVHHLNESESNIDMKTLFKFVRDCRDNNLI